MGYRPYVKINAKGEIIELELDAASVNGKTIQDGKLILKVNGTEVGTFTANSSTDKTVNITVPTKVSELTNDSKFLKENGTYVKNLSLGNGNITITYGNGTSDTQEFDANSAILDGNGDEISTTYQKKLTAGNNITIDSNNKISATNTTYSNATTSKDGLMSKTDKANLDTIINSFSNEDSNTTIDTIKEVLKVFENAPEGTNFINALATKADKATTLEGYGISDTYTKAEIDDKIPTDTGATSVAVLGSGNAVTDASYSDTMRKITLTKGKTFAEYSKTVSDVWIDEDEPNVLYITKGGSDYEYPLPSGGNNLYRHHITLYIVSSEEGWSQNQWVEFDILNSNGTPYTTESQIASVLGEYGRVNCSATNCRSDYTDARIVHSDGYDIYIDVASSDTEGVSARVTDNVEPI